MALTGQVVLVTGASQGLGRSIALALAEEDARVVLVARDGQRLNRVATEIEAMGREALVVCCDVCDSVQVTAMVARALGEFQQIDTVVNSAGIGLRKPALETTGAQWDAIFDTLVKGTFLVTQAVLPGMLARKRGNIINLVAPLERIELPGFAAYTAAKYAVVGLTKTLAKELRRYSINVNGLHPGGFANTAMVQQVMGSMVQSLLDPAVITPAAVALAGQPGRGLTGDIIDAVAWNTDPGLGAGLQ
ncbi:MAG: SDR family oxidoreductase [Herpetosiphonaceae bacterium]|nr:SDR family oxidoreductase [Herpetosiphonaceae bacterium]